MTEREEQTCTYCGTVVEEGEGVEVDEQLFCSEDCSDAYFADPLEVEEEEEEEVE